MDQEILRLRKILAANIKKKRNILGLTQEKLAEKAEISANMMNDIEGCRTWVSDKTLIKLAGALEIEVYSLLLPNAVFESDDKPVSALEIAYSLQNMTKNLITSLKMP
ncbi:MAG: helix-turn-helix domain-containing protein [Treponema sp.]|jgi:transcriptional regulator with XRE-family HTH domain|nr:helix-turn-helix domain-containing protein [Treponema sp.]